MTLKPGDPILVGNHHDFAETICRLADHGVLTRPDEKNAHLIIVTKVLEGGDHGRD